MQLFLRMAMDPLRVKMRAKCDEMGIHWARAVAPGFVADIKGQYMREWIAEYEDREIARKDAKQFDLAERSTDAAEKSAEAAIESAKTSSASTRAAIFSAVVSFAAFVVAVAAYMKQGS